MRLKKKNCVNSNSTWQIWLSDFVFGWNFLKQERVPVLWLGVAEGNTAKVVNLGFVFPTDIKVSPEPLYFSGPFWGTKAKTKTKPKENKNQPLVSWRFEFGGKTGLARSFAWVCLLLWRLVSPSCALPLLFYPKVPCHSSCSNPLRFLLSLNHVLILKNHLTDEGSIIR